MKTSKTFQEVLKNLEEGAEQIKRRIDNSQSFREVQEIKKDLKIQLTKIDFLKKGYNFARRELSCQKHL